MAVINGIGPGGRVARAKKRLDKAVSKLPASTDNSSEHYRKMSKIDKTKSKVAKGVARLDSAVAKAVEKKRAKMASGKSSDFQKSLMKFTKDQSKSAINYLKGKKK